MSFVNALALGGLAFVALPVLVHLMGRAPAKVLRFPSLRFLEASRLLPSKRTRIQDPLLMVLRALVLALAAIALAGPVFSDTDPGAGGSVRAIAVVLDTSASVQRGGGLPLGRGIADSVAREATSGAVIPVARLADAIDGAAAWLATQQGAREIALISDFQLGAIDSADLARFPAGTRVRVQRIPVPAPSGQLIARTVQGGAEVTARVRQVGNGAEVTWARGMRATRPSAPLFEVLAGPGEAADVALARRAARVVGSAPSDDTTRRVALVYASYPGRDELLRASKPLDQPWQGEVVSRLLLGLRPLAFGLTPSALGLRPLAFGLDGSRLLVFIDAPVVSELSVSVQAELSRAIAGPLGASELEPHVMGDRALASLAAITTEPAAASIAAAATESAARRWFWVAALILLGAEWLVRRAPRKADV